MDVKKFCERIQFDCKDDLPRNLATLTEIQHKCQLNLTWNNLDTVMGKPLGHSIEAFYQKIVVEGRGGWCHELNGLLCWALQHLGFKATMLCANVGGDYDHMVLQVDLGEEGLYLGEIGFGMTKENYSPLKVEADIVQTMQTGHYKLTKDGEQWTIFWAPLEDSKPKTLDDENWERLFSFRLGECQLGDYEEASKFLQTGESEGIRFMATNPICMKRFKDGSCVDMLVQRKYRRYVNVGTSSRHTSEKEDNLDKDGMERILRERFNMKVDLGGLDLEKWSPDYKPPVVDWRL